MVPTLWLVRHGETAWTRAGRYQGRADPSLTVMGKAEARAAGQILAAHGVRLVISSPLARARQTACLAAPAGVPILIDPRLMELDFGAWEGLTQVEVRHRFPQALRRWKREPAVARPPGGETLAEASARWHDFLADPPWIYSPGGTSAPGPVAVVTHAAIIRLALLAAAGAGLDGFRGMAVPVGSVRRLDGAYPRAQPIEASASASIESISCTPSSAAGPAAIASGISVQPSTTARAPRAIRPRAASASGS